MIASNAGVDGSIVLQKVRESDGSFGYRARLNWALTAKYEDLVESGVIDPTKVVRVSAGARSKTPHRWRACCSRPKPWSPRSRSPRAPAVVVVPACRIWAVWAG